MSKGNVLLVEDEPGIAVTVRDRLCGEGYEVTVRDDGSVGFEAALAGGYDLILLDLMLPGKDGLDICRDLRSRGVDTPIIMVTAKSQIVDRVLGLKLGADDYLLKPFDFMELSARIEAVLRRRADAGTAESVRFGPFVLEFRAKRLLMGDKPVELSFQEYKLLEFFVRHRNRVLSRDELLDAVWGFQHIPTTRTVDVHVAWLRQKLRGETEQYIQTVRKHGYRFVG